MPSVPSAKIGGTSTTQTCMAESTAMRDIAIIPRGFVSIRSLLVEGAQLYHSKGQRSIKITITRQ